VTLACANLFIGIITTVTTFVLENFDDEELKAIGSVLKVQYSQGPKCTSKKPKNRRDKEQFFQNCSKNFEHFAWVGAPLGSRAHSSNNRLNMELDL
jgi:hypothetical protein